MDYQDGNRKLISCLSPAVNVIQAFSGVIGEAVSLVSYTCHIITLLKWPRQIPFQPANALYHKGNGLIAYKRDEQRGGYRSQRIMSLARPPVGYFKLRCPPGDSKSIYDNPAYSGDDGFCHQNNGWVTFGADDIGRNIWPYTAEYRRGETRICSTALSMSPSIDSASSRQRTCGDPRNPVRWSSIPHL